MGRINSLFQSSIKESLRWFVVGLTIAAGAGLAWTEWQGLSEIRSDHAYVVLGEVFMALIFVTTCVPLWLISYAIFARKFYVVVEAGAVLLASGAFCGSFWILTQVPIPIWIQVLKGPFYSAHAVPGWAWLNAIEEGRLLLLLVSLPFALAGGTYYICRTLGHRTRVRPPPLNLERHAV